MLNDARVVKMNEPILKMHWERFKAHVDLDVAIAVKLLLPFTESPIDQLFFLSEGCANTNYKVTFKNNRAPVVIRIYMREKSALRLEVDIHRLVENEIPVPKHFYSDDQCKIYEYPYAIMEWIDGTLMREVILSEDKKAISECAYEAGKYLNELRKIKFNQGGFFQENLRIRPFGKEEKYLPYVLNLLQDKGVRNDLDAHLHHDVSELVNTYSKLLPDENEANLTHADYDPANIMVKLVNGNWKIVAILDWEFSYAGTYLLDIGMMLRYSHKLPICYESRFIAGLTETGLPLPLDWKKQAKLMDLLCLLQLVHCNSFAERPKMNRDVVSLIADTVKNWGFF